VAITWPLVATRLKRNLPVEPFLSTNVAAMRPPWVEDQRLAAATSGDRGPEESMAAGHSGP
jgi:hypothetical protein